MLEAQYPLDMTQICIMYWLVIVIVISNKDAIKAGSFYLAPKLLSCGDVDTAFDQADHVIEGESHMGGQEHFYLETHATLAVPCGEDGEMELFVSTQNASETQVSQI